MAMPFRHGVRTGLANVYEGVMALTGFRREEGRLVPSLRSRRAFSVASVAAMVLAGLYGVVVVLSPQAIGPEGLGAAAAAIPGWEPWYFYVDNKVNAGSGNLFLNATDVRVPARGHVLEVVRAYNSQDGATDGDFGYGWTWNYGTSLSDYGTAILWRDGDGSQHTYLSDFSGGWIPPAGVHARLTTSGGEYDLWHLDGSVWHFGSDGLPEVWTDRNGNDLTFTWASPPPSTGPELEKVQDDSGLNLMFAYRSGRIEAVEDPLGRRVLYAYDGSGNLDSVTDPLAYADRHDYDGSHRMTRWIDRADVLFQFAHDGSDRLTDLNVSLYDAGSDGPVAGSTIDKLEITYTLFDFFGNAWTNVTNARNDVGSVRIDENANTNLPDRLLTPVAGTCGAMAMCTRLAAAKGGGGCGAWGPASLKGDSYGLTWDSDNNLIAIEDALGYDYNYSYNGYGLAETYTDPLGNTTQWGWTVYDNSTSYLAILENRTDARGSSWDFDHDANGNRINVTDPLGNYSTMGYDAQGHMTSRTDFRGNAWMYGYNTHGWGMNVTDPLGNLTAFGYDDAGRTVNVTNARGYLTAYGWDDANRLRNITDARDNVTAFTYNGRGDRLSTTDALNRTTTYAWNLTVGKIASVTDALGNTTTYAYDGEGNLLTLTNRRGHATTYLYDGQNRVTNVTDALGNQTTYEYDAAGRMTTVTDRRGAETSYGYDGLGRRVNVTDALGNLTAYAYDEVGNMVNLTNARGYSTLFTYDALNRLTEVEDALGNASTRAYDENGNLVNATDEEGHSDLFGYDELNRRASVTDAIGHETTYAYDEVGNLVSVTDANGNMTSYTYDELNRRTVDTDANGDNTTYAYDAVGNLVTLTDANDHATTQEYDELNRLSEIVRPLGNTTTYEYDEEGNVVVRIDPKGQQTNYTYDALDRLTRVDYPDASNVTAHYDEEGNTVYAEGWGFSRTDAWDLLGRVTEIEFDFGPFNKTVSYAYDEVGNRVMMTDGEGDNTTYVWDALDRLESMTAPDNLWWNFTYDASSHRTNLTYPNGIYTATTYNDADWITLVESRTSNHSTLESFTYVYDDVGNRVNITYENGTTVAYVYDDVYRLTEENYSWGLTIAYAYDGTGNRLSETRNGGTMNYMYDAEDHLTVRGNATYDWDGNGNLVTKAEWDGNTTYVWDYENRLANVALANGTVLAYAYSARGPRVSESVDGDVSYVLHDFYDSNFDDVIAEYNGTGVRKAAFTHGPGIDEPLAVTRSQTLYVLRDALGSVTATATSDGADSHRYEAFGTALGTLPDRYGFTSREMDVASGLYHYRARWYDPASGRFLAKDPLGFVDGPNLYTYVSNIPVMFPDPSGKDHPWWSFCIHWTGDQANWLRINVIRQPGWDKWSHCVWGCLMVSHCYVGVHEAAYWAVVKEEMDRFGPTGFDELDIIATVDGAENGGQWCDFGMRWLCDHLYREREAHCVQWCTDRGWTNTVPPERSPPGDDGDGGGGGGGGGGGKGPNPVMI